MKTAGGSLLLFISITSVTLGSAFADSTEEALNEFYSVIGPPNLTSEVPQNGTKPRPTKSVGNRRAKAPKNNEISDVAGEAAAANADSRFLYRPSDAVTKKVQTVFLSQLDQQPDESSRVLVEKDASDIAATQARFDALFYRYGFSSRNVSDSYAGYLLILWEIVNDQDASTHPTGIMQFRAQMNKNTGLARSDPFWKSDARKQYTSESFKLLGIILLDKLETRKAANNSAGIERERNVLHQSVLNSFKIDLKKLQLSDTGFKNI